MLIETHLVGFWRVDSVKANFHVADCERVAIHNARNARDRIGGQRFGDTDYEIRKTEGLSSSLDRVVLFE